MKRQQQVGDASLLPPPLGMMAGGPLLLKRMAVPMPQDAPLEGLLFILRSCGGQLDICLWVGIRHVTHVWLSPESPWRWPTHRGASQPAGALPCRSQHPRPDVRPAAHVQGDEGEPRCHRLCRGTAVPVLSSPLPCSPGDQVRPATIGIWAAGRTRLCMDLLGPERGSFRPDR